MITKIMAELCTLSEHSQFDASSDDMLHDQLVCGIRDERL